MKKRECKYCGLIFTEKDYKNASIQQRHYDICYPCQFKEVAK